MAVHHDAATRRSFATVAEHFTSAQTKLLACLLGLQPPGRPIHETDRQIGKVMGIAPGNVRKHLIVLKTKVLPGHMFPVIEVQRGGEKGRKKRRIVVHLPGAVESRQAQQAVLPLDCLDRQPLGIHPRAFTKSTPSPEGGTPC